ncbi:MAG: hypothetical protein QOH17_3048 [Pseudonocardiales bacterium]|nr:hypothetical protein [Pseudonocardiales bacterium]
MRPGRMGGSFRTALVLAAAVGTLALGGCRGRVAADPLGSIESSISAVEKQVDQDGTG